MSSAASRATIATGGVDVEYLDRLKRIRLSRGVVDDVLDTYAAEHFEDFDAREQFMDQMSEPPLGPQAYAAVLSVIYAVVAATELPTEDAFRALVSALDLDQGDDLLLDLKHAVFRQHLQEDDVDTSIITVDEFRRRLRYANERIDG